MDYTVKKIKSTVGKEFIREHHYSHGCHNGPMTWGLYDEDRLIGVLAIATPCSENVRASIFGYEYVNRVTELHRLVILDCTPKNTESWFIAKVLDDLHKIRPDLWAVVSFADATEGHVGTIYQASNALFYGTSGKAWFYLDPDGRLRHPRQNGINISASTAEARGWKRVRRDGKYRYLFLLGSRTQRRWSRRNLCVRTQAYPSPVA